MGYVCPWENEPVSGPTIWRIAAGRCQCPTLVPWGTRAPAGECGGLVCASCGRCQHCGQRCPAFAVAPVGHTSELRLGGRAPGLYIDGLRIPA